MLDASEGEDGEPIRYVHGYGMLVPGLEAALVGPARGRRARRRRAGRGGLRRVRRRACSSSSIAPSCPTRRAWPSATSSWPSRPTATRSR